MPNFSDPTIIVVIAVVAFFVVAKMFKVEKGAVVLALAAFILWLILHFTGYDKVVYRVIFNAPPVEPAKPEDLWKR